MSLHRPDRFRQERDWMERAFPYWFAFCAVLGLAVVGVAIWAVIRVVGALT